MCFTFLRLIQILHGYGYKFSTDNGKDNSVSQFVDRKDKLSIFHIYYTDIHGMCHLFSGCLLKKCSHLQKYSGYGRYGKSSQCLESTGSVPDLFQRIQRDPKVPHRLPVSDAVSFWLFSGLRRRPCIAENPGIFD